MIEVFVNVFFYNFTYSLTRNQHRQWESNIRWTALITNVAFEKYSWWENKAFENTGLPVLCFVSSFFLRLRYKSNLVNGAETRDREAIGAQEENGFTKWKAVKVLWWTRCRFAWNPWKSRSKLSKVIASHQNDFQPPFMKVIKNVQEYFHDSNGGWAGILHHQLMISIMLAKFVRTLAWNNNNDHYKDDTTLVYIVANILLAVLKWHYNLD